MFSVYVHPCKLVVVNNAFRLQYITPAFSITNLACSTNSFSSMLSPKKLHDLVLPLDAHLLCDTLFRDVLWETNMIFHEDLREHVMDHSLVPHGIDVDTFFIALMGYFEGKSHFEKLTKYWCLISLMPGDWVLMSVNKHWLTAPFHCF